jgi:alkanesulfonate monooxygenase SsuD/methylene tetrahydromethanopterin reductase-like flavin-dependent oxidoreductase (luciferase family)
VLGEHCEAVGRDDDAIEKTVLLRACVRDTTEAAHDAYEHLLSETEQGPPDSEGFRGLVGTPAEVGGLVFLVDGEEHPAGLGDTYAVPAGEPRGVENRRRVRGRRRHLLAAADRPRLAGPTGGRPAVLTPTFLSRRTVAITYQ